MPKKHHIEIEGVTATSQLQKRACFQVVINRRHKAGDAIACVAGAKRGGGGGREKGKSEGSPQSPSPFSLPPYPLLPTPFDACYAG